MVKSLDIDFYKEGFDVSIINCIDGPIAGAAGYYNFDNYFFYCFYYSMLTNWSEHDKNFINRTNFILNKFGLRIIPHYIDDNDHLISIIKSELDHNRPVIFVLKYNALFYNTYYKDKNNNRYHAIIINEYNPDNSIIGIKETTLVREILPAGINKDLFFSLKVKNDMIQEFWLLSNESFIGEKSEHTNLIYSIEKIGNPLITDYNELIADFLYHMPQFQNQFVKVVIEYEKSTDEFIKYPLTTKMNFCGSFNALFRGFENFLNIYNNQDAEVLSNFKTSYIEFRDIIFTKIHAAILRKKSISQEERGSIVNMALDLDRKLFDMISTFYKTNIKSNLLKTQIQYLYLDLETHLNNEAFALTLSDKTTADITGEGTHFLYTNWGIKESLQVGKLRFTVPLKKYDGQKDNISCSNQMILIPEAYYYAISFLGCSEFGSYSENFQINYTTGESQKIQVSFSDFYQAPLFKEKVVWIGDSAYRKNDIVKLHNFNARIFAYEKALDNTRMIASITLPNKSNIHIFAITLYKYFEVT